MKVELLGKNEKGLDKWKETPDMGGYILFEQLEKVPFEKLTLNMMESSFGMKGIWKYELKDEGGKTSVTISEKVRLNHCLSEAYDAVGQGCKY